MTKPDGWDQVHVDLALSGDMDSVPNAFIWADTPQGFEFWMRVSLAPELSPEAREILVNWSNEK